MNTRNRKVLASTVTAAALAAVVTGVAVASESPASPPTEDGTEVEEQEPALDGSIKFADDESTSEANEQAQLAELPDLISEQEAIDATGGTATSAELENENGSVVWEVEVTADDGTVEEVQVDAGTGDVLARETEADDESEAEDDDESEADEQDGVEHENEGEEGEHTDE